MSPGTGAQADTATAARGRRPVGIMLASRHPLPGHGCLPTGLPRLEGPHPAPRRRQPAPRGLGCVVRGHPGLPCPQRGTCGIPAFMPNSSLTSPEPPMAASTSLSSLSASSRRAVAWGASAVLDAIVTGNGLRMAP